MLSGKKVVSTRPLPTCHNISAISDSLTATATPTLIYDTQASSNFPGAQRSQNWAKIVVPKN